MNYHAAEKIHAAAAAAARGPLLNVQDLTLHFGVTERTIWRWVASGKFPPPLRVGPGQSPRWNALDVIKYELSLNK
jgi:predicted DNA-binding transcriptional regulator AlpA